MGKLYRILAVFLEKGDYSTVLYMAFVSQLHTDSLVTRHWSLVTGHSSLKQTPELVRGFSYISGLLGNPNCVYLIKTMRRVN